MKKNLLSAVAAIAIFIIAVSCSKDTATATATSSTTTALPDVFKKFVSTIQGTTLQVYVERNTMGIYYV